MSSSLNRRFLDVSLIVQGTANAPRGTLVHGMQYIVGDSPSGVFSGAFKGSIARYDDYTEKWTFTKPSIGKLEILDLSDKTIKSYTTRGWTVQVDLNGSGNDSEVKSIEPVMMIVRTGTSLPATAKKGEFFLNLSNGGLYTAIEENTWDEGLPISVGSRYASSTDRRIYERDEGGLKIEEIPDGGLFLNRMDDCIYTHDAVYQVLIKVGGDGQNGAVETSMTEKYTLTDPDIRIKSFMLSKPVPEGKEDSVIIFFGGLAWVSGRDFEVVAQAVSWWDKGFERLNLEAGDELVISYPTVDSGVI